MRFALVALAVLIAALPPVAGAAPSEPLGHAGRWITDADGRVVVLHGFNTVPFNEQILPRDMGMGPDNARWLADNGFNTIRLGLYYTRVEPQPGNYDDGYLDDYLRVQGELAQEGVFTLLDMHQDQLHPRYGTSGAIPSRGFPEWFLKDDGLPNTQTPYPAGYTNNPALNRAYDSIWQNFNAPDGVSVQDHFARGWQRIAARFRDRPGMLGYDIFNEPWPGSQYASCASPSGCPAGGFDQTLLTAFSRKLVAATRAADGRHLVFYEPNLQFDFGSATGVGDPGDTNAGFSFHGYCFGSLVPGATTPDQCGIQEEMVMDNAEAQSRRTGDALLLTEAGFDPPAARRVTELADRKMLSWQWWDYYGDNIDFVRPNLPILIRPYPQLVAGTPQNWSFNSSTQRFDLAYSTRRAGGEGARGDAGRQFAAGTRSEVFVPELHYGGSHRAEVKGAEVVSRPNARRLVIASCRGADRVTVRVTNESWRDPLSCEEQAALARGRGILCLPRRLAVSHRRIGPARIGRSLRAFTRRYRVVRRLRGGQRFCVRGGGRFFVGSRRGRIDLVVSTGRGHRTRAARPGRRLSRRRLSVLHRRGRGLFVGQRRRAGRVLYGLRRRRVRFIGVASRRVVARSARLTRRLRSLGLARR